jgi:hypothetical protein
LQEDKLYSAKMGKDTVQQGLYKFYTSLLKQNPNSKMAKKWCLNHGINDTIQNLQKLKVTKKITK